MGSSLQIPTPVPFLSQSDQVRQNWPESVVCYELCYPRAAMGEPGLNLILPCLPPAVPMGHTSVHLPGFPFQLSQCSEFGALSISLVSWALMTHHSRVLAEVLLQMVWTPCLGGHVPLP